MEKHVKIAYLVIAYMDPEQLKRLALRLTKTSDIYIHINSSVDIVPFQEALTDLPGPGRVIFSEKRFRIVWAGYTILKAAFSMIEQAFQQEQYDRFVLLTGLDYPIKSDEEIQAFFQEHSDVEYVRAAVVKGEKYDHLYYHASRDHKLLHKCFQMYEKLLRRLGRKGKPDYVRYRGKKYPLYGIAPKWALTGTCAKYVLNFYKNNPRFNRYFQLMHAPDDFYVATVLFNSAYRDHIEAEYDIFKIVWLPADKGAKILTEEDYTELTECRQLYAKKFQSDYSEKLQQMLDRGVET